MKLISPPIFLEDPAAWTETEAICERLRGDQYHMHGATIDEFCGLYVQVKPRDGDFDLLTLQHLFYILVMYESQIDLMFPHHRRVGNPENWEAYWDLWSNANAFIREHLTRGEDYTIITEPLDYQEFPVIRKQYSAPIRPYRTLFPSPISETSIHADSTAREA